MEDRIHSEHQKVHHRDHFSCFLGRVELSSSPLCTSSQQTVPFKFVHRGLDASGWFKAERKFMEIFG